MSNARLRDYGINFDHRAKVWKFSVSRDMKKTSLLIPTRNLSNSDNAHLLLKSLYSMAIGFNPEKQKMVCII